MKILNPEPILADNKYFYQINDKDIYVVDQFLSPEECKMAYDFLQTKTEAEWRASYDSVMKRPEDRLEYWADKIYNLEPVMLDFTETITRRLHEYISKEYDGQLTGLKTVQKHYKGVGLPYHYDSQHDNELDYAVILYINDNFEGGLLHFPKEENVEGGFSGAGALKDPNDLSGTLIKPKAGNLIIFSTEQGYVHGVTPVTSDDFRYAMVCFFKKNRG